MDIYSLARRLGRPFRFEQPGIAPTLPIGDRAFIGDGFTSALVRVDGVIDWLCLPRFDSPSVFGALLDPERGGSTFITPTKRPFDAYQRYDPDTNVLETLFQVEGQGVARLTDFMPWHDDPRAAIHEVHRRLEVLEGQVSFEVVFDPRFDYGRGETHLERQHYGLLARGAAGERLVAVLSGEADWAPREAGGMRCEVTLGRGEHRWMVLSWDAPNCEPIAAYRPFEQLRTTRQAWRAWSHRLAYDGPWRHHVLRSALALKLLIYAPTGAMVAAPTTSLPEWIGSHRNWDYRFCWIRDAAMGIRAANLLGYSAEAREFFHFIRDTVDQDHGLRVMYAIDGATTPEERVLGHLRGYAGSAPVRIGNGARDQVQLDTAGALLDAASLYEQYGGSLTLRVWREIRAVVHDVERQWCEPDHGIWEPRSGRRHNVHSKVMSWLALQRGARLATLFGAGAAQRAWQAEADQVRADVLANGLDARGEHFVSAYGGARPDAALLVLPVLGFLPGTDPRVVRTLDWVRATLGDGPFLHRYHEPDGVGGPEGAFVLCGFWLAEALAAAGRLEEAQEVFVAHAEASNHVGLLAEEIDPSTRAQLGNFPQGFSHMGLINAAVRIDRALRRRDEGSTKARELMGPGR